MHGVMPDNSETQLKGTNNKLGLKHVKMYCWGPEIALKSFSRKSNNSIAYISAIL